MADLHDRTAIITGGTRGIGRAIAFRLAAEGMSVVIGYLENGEEAATTAEELRSQGAQVVVTQGDIAKPNTATKLVDAALGAFGRLDCLVNNAGITRDAQLQRLGESEYAKVLGVNLIGAALLATASTPSMIEAGFGRIVNIASFVGQRGNFGQANYAASKAGLIAWTKVAAIELARYDITVNAVCPGFIETEMLLKVDERVRERLLKDVPLRRFGKPEEIADAVAFALKADYMTGAQLNVNGGVHM